MQNNHVCMEPLDHRHLNCILITWRLACKAGSARAIDGGAESVAVEGLVAVPGRAAGAHSSMQARNIMIMWLVLMGQYVLMVPDRNAPLAVCKAG